MSLHFNGGPLDGQEWQGMLAHAESLGSSTYLILDHEGIPVMEARIVRVPKASFTCPRCRLTTYLPHDVSEGYCGRCHEWTWPDGESSQESPAREGSRDSGVYHPGCQGGQ